MLWRLLSRKHKAPRISTEGFGGQRPGRQLYLFTNSDPSCYKRTTVIILLVEQRESNCSTPLRVYSTNPRSRTWAYGFGDRYASVTLGWQKPGPPISGSFRSSLGGALLFIVYHPVHTKPPGVLVWGLGIGA